jgi:hypothetical protein
VRPRQGGRFQMLLPGTRFSKQLSRDKTHQF